MFASDYDEVALLAFAGRTPQEVVRCVLGMGRLGRQLGVELHEPGDLGVVTHHVDEGIDPGIRIGRHTLPVDFVTST